MMDTYIYYIIYEVVKYVYSVNAAVSSACISWFTFKFCCIFNSTQCTVYCFLN